MKLIKTLWFPILMFVVALLAAGLSYAQQALNDRLSWQAPTEYTDGSAIAAGDLVSYTISCGSQSGNYVLTMVVPGDTTQATRDELMASMGLMLGANYYCALQATTANELTSAYSNEVFFNLPDTRVPNAPVLTIE